MRQTGLITLSVLVMFSCRPAAAEESSWGWLWPFGQEKQAEQPYPTTDTPAARPARRTSGRATLRRHTPQRHETGKSKPLFSDFEIAMPHIWPDKSEAEETRNAWTGTSAEPESASPWQVVTDGTQRLGESTRNAWHKTVDVLTPEYLKADSQPAPRMAQRDPFWKRAFGFGEEEPKDPQTVTEWMAQERLNP